MRAACSTPRVLPLRAAAPPEAHQRLPDALAPQEIQAAGTQEGDQGLLEPRHHSVHPGRSPTRHALFLVVRMTGAVQRETVTYGSVRAGAEMSWATDLRRLVQVRPGIARRRRWASAVHPKMEGRTRGEQRNELGWIGWAAAISRRQTFVLHPHDRLNWLVRHRLGGRGPVR